MRETSTTIRVITVNSTRTTTPKRSNRAPSWPLVAAVAWTLFAFGGLYTWTLVPLALIVVVGLFIVRPPVGAGGSLIDISLASCVIAVAIQIIPIPPAARATLSPHADAVRGALQIGVTDATLSLGPTSIEPAATAASLAYITILVLLFWLARSVFERGGLRVTVRSIAWLGLTVSVVAIVALSTSPVLIYGFWRPDDASARPFGPFVNRNHMATWLLLALPVVGGYLMAHVRASLNRLASRGLALVRAMDATTIWQTGALVSMAAALFVSLSRSGVIGFVVSAAAGFALARAKLGSLKMRWLVGAALFAVAIATYLANFDQLAGRFAEAFEGGYERAEIWRQTVPIVRDFAITGTGEGTFRLAMLVYQRGDRQLLFNQAHNQYLQIAAEGGLLVGLPALCAMMAVLLATARALRRDTSALFWIRTGAAAGLAAVGAQGLWETGLRMPANGVLLAVCAALAVHGDAHAVSREGTKSYPPNPVRHIPTNARRTPEGGAFS